VDLGVERSLRYYSRAAEDVPSVVELRLALDREGELGEVAIADDSPELASLMIT